MNYNKQNLYIQDNSTLLTTHLIKNLPPKVASWRDKNSFNLRLQIPTLQALENSKWIEYNQSWLNSLIIDIDTPITIDEAFDKCWNIGFEPTWICKTDNGVHISFALENIVKYEWDKAIILARIIKQKLTGALGGDTNGSHRLKGIWRNPLLHEFYYTGILYSLNDFKTYLTADYPIQQKFHIERNKNLRKTNNFGYKKGYRNDYIFRASMVATKGKKLSLEDTIEIVNNLHLEACSTNKNEGVLTEVELRATARSVFKYNFENKNIVSSSNNFKSVNDGVMGFKKINNLSKEEYKHEVKIRRVASANRTNTTIEGDINKMATREKHIKKVHKKKTDLTYKKVKDATTGLMADEFFRKKNGNWNATAIAKYTNLTDKTVRKYLKIIKEEEETFDKEEAERLLSVF